MRKLCALLILVVMYGCNEPKIQEYELDMLVSSMRDAVEQKDIDKLRSQFTDDATIEMVMPAELGGTKRYAIGTYLKDVAAGWKMGIDQTYRVENLQMQIADDGQSAVISDTAYEDAIVQGSVVMSSKTEEKIEVVRAQNEIKIKKIYGDMKIL